MVSTGKSYTTQKGVVHPLIVLALDAAGLDSPRAFSFGLTKAKLILAHIADIQAYVAAAEQFVAQREAQTHMQRASAFVPGVPPVQPQAFVPPQMFVPQPVPQAQPQLPPFQFR